MKGRRSGERSSTRPDDRVGTHACFEQKARQVSGVSRLTRQTRHGVQLVAYGGSERTLQWERASHLSVARCVQGTFLGVFASFVVLSEVGIARLLHDKRRWRRCKWRSPSGLARVDASSSLALSDETSGALVGDDLEVVRATGVQEIDRRLRPLAGDDDPLFLSHGDVLCVVVPIIPEGVELALKFAGNGRDDGIVGVLEEVIGASECECFGAEEIVYFTPDLWSDGGCVGHGVMIRMRE